MVLLEAQVVNIAQDGLKDDQRENNYADDRVICGDLVVIRCLFMNADPLGQDRSYQVETAKIDLPGKVYPNCKRSNPDQIAQNLEDDVCPEC